MVNQMSERFEIIEPKHCYGTILLYDTLLEKVCIEISTGNHQMNRIMMNACVKLMRGADKLDLKELMG